MDEVKNDYTTITLSVPNRNNSKQRGNYLIPFSVPNAIIKSLSKNITLGNTIVIKRFVKTKFCSNNYYIELVAKEIKFVIL